MRVLVLKANYFPVCGASRLLEAYLPYFNREVVEPVLAEVATAGRPSSIHFVSERLRHLEHVRIHWSGARKARSAVRALKTLVQDLRIDAVNSHDMRCDLLCRLAGGSLGLGVPWIAHVHGWVGREGEWKIRAFEAIDRFCIRRADEIWVGSNAAWTDVRRGFPRPDDIRLLVNAVDPCTVGGARENSVAARASLGLPPGAFLVGMHARMHRAKGHHLLAEAALRAKTPEVHALLLGYGTEEASLRAAASLSDARGRVHVPGELSPRDTLAFVAALDLYVYPSLRESLPLAVLEAMLLGRPVVASEVGDLRDVLEAPEGGIIVPPGDVGSLAAAIDRIAADAGLRARLAGRGEEIARTRFAPRRLAIEMQEAFGRLLGRRSA